MDSIPFLNLDYIYQLLYDLFFRGYLVGFWEKLLALIALLAPYAFLLCALLLWGIIYCLIRINQIAEKDEEKHHKAMAVLLSETRGNPRWERIVSHMQSESESEWRLAILEADIVLGELLDHMQYHGETIADRLKMVEESDFPRLQDAWEAHKARNKIAHEGSSYTLTHHEAKRIIALYQGVFMDVKFI